jgi:hypothetical protein
MKTVNIALAELIKEHIQELGIFKKVLLGNAYPNDSNPNSLPIAMILYRDMIFNADSASDISFQVWFFWQRDSFRGTSTVDPIQEMFLQAKKVVQVIADKREAYEDLLCIFQHNIGMRQEYSLERIGQSEIEIRPPLFACSVDINFKYNGFNI